MTTLTNKDAAANPAEKQQTLTQKASRSIFWNFLNAAGGSAIRFVSTAILARLLLPRDFGIVGMALLVTGIIQLFGKLGMGAALVQRKDADEEYFSTAFWASVLVGGLLALAAVALSALAADFFQEPAIRLIICVLSLNFIFSSLASVHMTIIARELLFKTLTLVDLSCTLLRVAVALTLAFLGFGFWSIVVAIVVERIVKTILFMWQVKWRPRFVFNKEKFANLFRFGRNLYGQSFLGYFNANIDYIVTGRFLGATSLGFYQFAYNVPHLVRTHITQCVNEVAFPLYSQVQDDLPRVVRGYLKTVKFVSMITFPLMFGLFFTAEDFIATVYGTKWLPAVLPLKVLCVSGALRSVFAINGSLLHSQGRPDISLKWQCVMLPVTVAAIIFSSRWGLIGVASAMAVLSLFTTVLVIIGLRLIKSRFASYLRALAPAFVSSFLMVLALWGLNSLDFYSIASTPLRLLSNTAIGLLLNILFLRTLFKYDLAELVAFGRKVVEKS